jgi:hypothetical protein
MTTRIRTKKPAAPKMKLVPVDTMGRSRERDTERTARNKEIFLSKLRDALGIVKAACDATGIHRTTYYWWMTHDPVFKKAADDLIEERIDVAEAALVKSIKEGQPAAIIFFLKTKAKHRGYVERMEHVGTAEAPIVVHHGVDMQWLNEELPKEKLAGILGKLHSANGRSEQ